MASKTVVAVVFSPPCRRLSVSSRFCRQKWGLYIRSHSKSGPRTKWQLKPFPYDLPHPQTVTDPKYTEPDFFEKAAAQLPLGPSYIDSLTHLWKEKMTTREDLIFKQEDSLIKTENHGLPQLDPMTPKLGYEKVEALKTAPESVQKIFSVGYGERSDMAAVWKEKTMGAVRESPMDSFSLEAKIGRYTALIRAWSKLVDEIATKTSKKPKWLIEYIRVTLNSRRKALRLLRSENSERFEKVLKELQISFYVPGAVTQITESKTERTRMAWIAAQVEKRAEAEKEKRMLEYRLKLVKEKEKTEAELDEKLERLRDERDQLRNELNQMRTQSGEAIEVAGKYEPRTIDQQKEIYEHNYYYNDTWYAPKEE